VARRPQMAADCERDRKATPYDCRGTTAMHARYDATTAQDRRIKRLRARGRRYCTGARTAKAGGAGDVGWGQLLVRRARASTLLPVKAFTGLDGWRLPKGRGALVKEPAPAASATERECGFCAWSGHCSSRRNGMRKGGGGSQSCRVKQNLLPHVISLHYPPFGGWR
jgi:hypothetical protein